MSRRRLTKKMYFSLETGVEVMSGNAHNAYTPVYHAQVPESDEDREIEWKMMKHLKVDGRKCFLSTDECWKTLRQQMEDVKPKAAPEENDPEKRIRVGKVFDSVSIFVVNIGNLN